MIKCSKCGSEFEDGTRFCTKCGERLTSGDFAEKSDNKTEFSWSERNNAGKPAAGIEKPGKSSGTIYLILAIAVLALSVYASFKINSAGNEIASIRSIGGRTLEEAYYEELGNIYKGFSAAILAAGTFFSATLFKWGNGK